jgi:FKBP-type peptidyl-prolyl cis-trans isomerase
MFILVCHQVELPSGVRYTDLRVGGGQRPIKGYLVVVDYV